MAFGHDYTDYTRVSGRAPRTESGRRKDRARVCARQSALSGDSWRGERSGAQDVGDAGDLDEL